MYVDDKGSFKELPLNYRASKITEECGILFTIIFLNIYV